MTIVNQPLTLKFDGSGPQTLSNSDGSAVTSTTNANLIVITTPQAGPPVPIDRAGAPLDLSANVTQASAGPFPQTPVIVPSDAQQQGNVLSPYSVSEPPGAIVVASPAPSTPAAQTPTPIALCGSALSSWFQAQNYTADANGISSLADTLNPASPAVQATNARKPQTGMTGNGLPIISWLDDALQVPLGTQNNGATQWGFGCFVRQRGGSSPTLFSIDSAGGGGASVRKLLMEPAAVIQTRASDFVFNASSTTARLAVVNGAFPLNTFVFFTFELNLGLPGAPETIRCVISLDGVVQTITFSDGVGAPGTMPSSMPVPTGFFNLGAQNAATGSNPFVGDTGPDIYLWNSAMPGAAEGLLTPAARTGLAQYNRPLG